MSVTIKRYGAILAALVALATSGIGAASAATTQPTVVPESQPPFSFCNDTGQNNSAIACFSANIEFNNRDTFTLTHVRLSDTDNDKRAVYALVEWNGGYDVYAYCVTAAGGAGFTFQDDKGYNTHTNPVGGTHRSSDGISYVKIELFACNGLGTSSFVYSAPRHNPWYKP